MPTKSEIDYGLEVAAQRLSAHIKGPRKYGWSYKSAGSIATLANGRQCWLKVQASARSNFNSRLWEGDISVPNIAAIKRPLLIEHIDWNEGDWLWRASLFELVEDNVCSDTPQLEHAILLAESWYHDLCASLNALSLAPSARVSVRQELIDRRVRMRFGESIDTRINNWCSVHGDLHWANLTAPKLAILDWEAWGTGPSGLDAAMLLAYTGLVPSIAERISVTFDLVLKSRDGLLSTLFVVSELLTMIERHNDHPALLPSLEELGRRTLAVLSAAHV